MNENLISNNLLEDNTQSSLNLNITKNHLHYKKRNVTLKVIVHKQKIKLPKSSSKNAMDQPS